MVQAKTNGEETGIILLAAGGSSRLGRPKQSLYYKGKTLLQYSLEQAMASNAQTVVVVLGAHADVLQKKISEQNIHIAINANWQEGMASSIYVGIGALTEICPSAKGAILVVCDQPFLKAALLNELMMAHDKTGKGIVASSYGDTFGPPVFFHRSFFPELLQLRGDVGARGIIRLHTDNVETIPFPEGVIDIDTDEDYEAIKEE